MKRSLRFVTSLLTSAKAWELDLRYDVTTPPVYLAPGDNFDVHLMDIKSVDSNWHVYVTQPNLLATLDQTDHGHPDEGTHIPIGQPFKRTLKFLAGPEDFHLVDFTSEHLRNHHGQGDIRLVYVKPPEPKDITRG